MKRYHNKFSLTTLGVRGGLVINCQSWCSGFKSQPAQIFGLRFLLHLRPLAKSAMSTLTVHCQWEDEMVMERTGHTPSDTEAKKMKSLADTSHP